MEAHDGPYEGSTVIKRLFRSVCPPVIKDLLTWLMGRQVRWSGAFSSFAEASMGARGYNDPDILRRVEDSVRSVLAGQAAYERDGVLFHDAEVRGLCLAAIGLAALPGRPTMVVDFGGSLASTWLQHRRAISFALDWRVVEQPHFVDSGKNLFGAVLNAPRFYGSINDALNSQEEPDLVLVSAVLHYLPDPEKIIREILEARPRFILVERTPEGGSQERFCLQEVPARIYPASYPCRIFATGAIQRLMGPGYQLIATEDSLDRCNLHGVRFRAWLFVRVNNV